MNKTKSVEGFIAKNKAWRSELTRLREILIGCGLDETIKWGAPCYTQDGKNVVGMGAFKSYFGLWFFQGALLEDKSGVLLNAQEGKTKALRQWRMTHAKDIKPTVIKRYVKAAAALARAGKSIPVARGRPLDIVPELAKALERTALTRNAFAKLRPGQQREYAQYVAEAKRDSTRARRVEKIVPMIRAGVGLNDKYRGGG